MPAACGEVAGGWFMWALRDAVAKAGYYQNGIIAKDWIELLRFLSLLSAFIVRIDGIITSKYINCFFFSKLVLFKKSVYKAFSD